MTICKYLALFHLKSTVNASVSAGGKLPLENLEMKTCSIKLSYYIKMKTYFYFVGWFNVINPISLWQQYSSTSVCSLVALVHTM